MTVHAGVLLPVSRDITLGGWDDLVEKLRESAHPIPNLPQCNILVEWSAMDLWELRGMVEHTVAEVEANFWHVEFPDRDDLDQESRTDLTRFAWWVRP